MSTPPLPSASIENDFLRVTYLTATGPRIIGLYVQGVEANLLAETPDIHWHTPHGEYYLHGGHRLWTAPENQFYICPEDHVNTTSEDHRICLRSRVDDSGLEKEISLRLDENCVTLVHRVTWHGKQPIELAPWTITQLRLGGMAILPQSDSGGLLPNRNIVLWPYSQWNDERLELYDDLILLHGRSSEEAFKIGNYNTHGWIAYALKDALFIKRFSVDHIHKYPDLGCNVESYVRDCCIELETLGALTTLEPQESMTYEETWEVIAGDYPLSLENARRMKKQLSLK